MKRKIFAIFTVLLLSLSAAAAVSATEYCEIPFEHSNTHTEGWYTWYRFWFEQGQAYDIRLQVPSSGDFDLYLEDSDSDIIKRSDSSTWGQDEQIVWTCGTTGEYYVVVDCYEGYGTYTVTVEETEASGSCLGTLLVTVFLVTAAISYSFVRFQRKKRK